MPRRNSGFTLVELLIIIVIMGILVGLTAFGYRGWQQGISQREVRSDLQIASSAMENAKNFGSGYPALTAGSVPPNFDSGSGASVVYVWGDDTRYCLQGTASAVSSITYFIDTTQAKTPQAGSCPSSPILPTQPPSAPSPVATAASVSTINVTWPNVTGATSYSVRYGTSSPTTPAGCTVSPCSISGLTYGTQYSVQVTASNIYGNTNSNTVTATTQTGVPGNFTGTVIGCAGGVPYDIVTIRFNWSMPTNGVAVDNYVVHSTAYPESGTFSTSPDAFYAKQNGSVLRTVTGDERNNGGTGTYRIHTETASGNSADSQISLAIPDC